jgi:hypothetical protein
MRNNEVTYRNMFLLSERRNKLRRLLRNNRINNAPSFPSTSHNACGLFFLLAFRRRSRRLLVLLFILIMGFAAFLLMMLVAQTLLSPSNAGQPIGRHFSKRKKSDCDCQWTYEGCHTCLPLVRSTTSYLFEQCFQYIYCILIMRAQDTKIEMQRKT